MAGASVAIIGAGIGGLTLAACLRRIGIAAPIYEQAPRFARVGAGLQLSPNAMKVMRAIGREPKLRALGFDPPIFRSRQWDTGAIMATLPKEGVMERKYGAPYLMFHRADVHAALFASIPAASVHFGKKLIGIDQGAAGITLAFADGSRARHDAVIACDGVHSVVRAAIVGPDKPRYTGRVGFRATFPAQLLGEVEIDENSKWWGPDRHIVHYFTNPRRDEVYFVTATPDPDFTIDSWSMKGDLRELRAAYEGFHPQIRALLTACPEVHKWALVQHDPLPRWTEGRIALLGDACHTMPPWMAQGAAQSIEDAAVLSRCLEGVPLDGIADAFRRYEATRKERTTKIQTVSVSNTFNRDTGSDPDWVYGYDAWTTPLAVG
ncbi:MAG TPA: FAD-dependent monooxygenase [Stellaceae bacterium]|nr:FAD-dependent monooxygenase [Stellaceae bacterium]